MSGKPYVMKEMKAIVEYLTEHRAYGEIKGRKMWMDLANSNVTNRTWQSLKETFLKRILPDIHNPYYKLTVTQISSFRQGQDIETKLNNRLQIQSTSQNSDMDGAKEKDTEKPGNDNSKNEDKIAGEDPIQSNLRASTETLVLENCYETAEEIRKDLQSPFDEVEDGREMIPTKSMRELITYSEPLTPMLQSVIDDFVTDDEDNEPQMQIVEPVETTDTNDENVGENIATINISDSEGNDIQEETNQKQTINPDVDNPSSPIAEEQATVPTNTKEIETIKEKSCTLLSEVNDTNNEQDSSEVKISEGENPKPLSVTTQNNSVNIADTLLPGNQEAFKEKSKNMSNKMSNQSLNKKTNLRKGRKRAISQDQEPKSEKKKLTKLKSISDSERPNTSNENIFKKSKHSTLQQTPEETQETSSNMNSEKCENTSKQEEIDKQSQNTVTNDSAEIENPCLKNVSLYAEQFSTQKYTDSDGSNMEDEKNKKGLQCNKKDDTIENTEDKDKIDKNYKTDDSYRKSKANNDKTNKKRDDENKNIDVDMNKEDKHKKINYNNVKAGNENKNIEVKKRMFDAENKTDDKNKKRKLKENSTVAQTIVQDNENDVVMLMSHSDSANETSIDPVVKGQGRLVKRQRDRALANMFGFASGGAHRRQRRSTGNRKRTASHSHVFNYGNMSSASSDCPSDTGSEYVSSPPRQHGRKGRHSRKYLKPNSAPILSLEEEGGLFVMYGKKIYPIVKDGKIVKNFVNLQEIDVDHDEAFWKLKYVEEKKKTAELTKLLNKAKEDKLDEPRKDLSVLPTTTKNSNALPTEEDTVKQVGAKPVSEAPAKQVQEPQANSDGTKTVKIKFIKKNEEVQLEGHWSQLNPVLAHVAQLFQKEPEPSSTKPNTDSPAVVAVKSGICTPIEEVVQKVNQRENEIAAEIERYYKEEANALEKHRIPDKRQIPKKPHVPEKLPAPENPHVPEKLPAPENPQVQDKHHAPEQLPGPEKPHAPEKLPDTEMPHGPEKLSAPENSHVQEKPDPPEILHHSPEKPPETQNNVTRRGRPPKSSTAKKAKLDVGTEANKSIEQMEETTPKENITTGTKRRTRTPKIIFSETDNQTNRIRTRSTTPRKSDENRYKFPSPPATKRRSYVKKSTPSVVAKNQRKTQSTTNLFTSPEDILDSIEAAQEYQDSHLSPSSVCVEQNNTRLTLSTVNTKRYTTRFQERTNPNITDDITSESSNSYQTAQIESVTFQNSTITSDIYKSESYRLLMNKDHIRNTSKLKRIAEANPPSKDFDVSIEAFNDIAASGNNDSNNKENIVEEVLQDNTDSENSSNLSLPTSPVLSIVENISISKTFLSSMDLDDPDDCERNDIEATEHIMLNGLMTPDDVTMPLMEQECGIEKSRHDGKAYHYNLSVPKTIPAVSESLLNQINTVNIEDQTWSESLNVKLRHLILESAKKSYKDKNTVNNETKDVEVKDKPQSKKANYSKRSSTPRKRQRRSTVNNCEPQIEEEHMETCSQRGRQSCPPIVLISEDDGNGMVTPLETESAQFLTVKSTKVRQKKDIIKVKITKPKSKTQNSSYKPNVRCNLSNSEINVTESDMKLQGSDDSVELIHNHSETCLNAHECMGDSVNIIENSCNPIISLDSNSTHTDVTVRHSTIGNLTQELFSSDAQDGSDVVQEFDFAEPRQVNSATTTVSHTRFGTPSSLNSIMTDDLSDEIPEEPVRNKRWYLFSEDESSNTNCFSVNTNSEPTGYAQLEQIFPVTCAVPDLSSITEMSRENGDSKKFCDNTNTRDNLNSPSVFI